MEKAMIGYPEQTIGDPAYWALRNGFYGYSWNGRIFDTLTLKEVKQFDVIGLTHIFYSEKTLIPRHIVCAAVKYDDLIICGARHFDTTMRKVMFQLGIKPKDANIQGFVDQYGNFVNRRDAKTIVIANKQKLREPIDGRDCFSENLY